MSRHLPSVCKFRRDIAACSLRPYVSSQTLRFSAFNRCGNVPLILVSPDPHYFKYIKHEFTFHLGVTIGMLPLWLFAFVLLHQSIA